MNNTCEICHNEEATGTKWIPASLNGRVGGTYRVGPKCGGPKKK